MANAKHQGIRKGAFVKRVQIWLFLFFVLPLFAFSQEKVGDTQKDKNSWEEVYCIGGDVIDKRYKTPDSDLQQTQWTFPAVKTTQLTIRQRADGGNAKRPNRMWINRVWAY